MCKIAKLILFLSVCLSVCVASKLKCAKLCDKSCPNRMSPCPMGVLCPRGTTLNRSEGGCCCESDDSFLDDRPEGPRPPRPNSCTGEHEIFKTCGSGCGDRRCGVKPSRICPTVCIRGCFCEEGYARDADNVCIKIELCEAGQRCKSKNETYNSCGSACAEKTCSISLAEKSCPDVCVPGCYCNVDLGYVRHKGVCILDYECPNIAKCPGINEIHQPFCYNDNCPPGMMCALGCSERCICRDGFVRNDQGTCVPTPSCESTCTGTFESCTDCGSGCGDFHCGDDPNRSCPEYCREGCFCDPGYARNANGECILISECPAKCGTNQIYDDCGSACGNFTCDSYGKPRICTMNCVAGCYCEKDCVSFEGECIKFTECPVIKKCSGKFESYTGCGSGCGDLGCGDDPNRICPAVCREGCFCNSGYARNQLGECIPISDCPAKCGKNQVYNKCGSSCGDYTCLNYGQARRCNKMCVPGCYCAEGYVKFRGECISFEQCPQTHQR